MFNWVTDFFNWLLDWEGVWTETHITIHKIANIAIFVSYMLIPLFLIMCYRAWKNKNLIIHNIKTGIVLFVLFILSCGISHYVGEVLFFNSEYYRLITFLHCITATISVWTSLWFAFAPFMAKGVKINNGRRITTKTSKNVKGC